jgi:hypothetical protein
MDDTLDSTDLYDWLTGTGITASDTNAGVNLPAAQQTSPVIANSDGTSSVSPSWLSTITSLINPAATAYATATGKPTATATPAASTPATSSTAMIMGVIAVMIVGVLMLMKGKK